jgi:N-methylhydantoinase A/oxoprolinase/acetone carboxylase beta subunit
MKLNKQKAIQVMKDRIADPLGMSVEEAATGINEILDTRMGDAALGMVMTRGYELSEYYLLAFGGAGPTHVAGYTKGANLKGVMLFPYSAVFSAFGAAAADYEHHYTKAVNIIVPPFASDDAKVELGRVINEQWQALEEGAYAHMEEEGFSRDKVNLRHLAMVRYARQLDDLIVTSPVARVNTPQDWDGLIDAFERMYERIYTVAGKYPEAGYEIFEVGLVASVSKIKPKLRKYPLASERPVDGALKGRRKCYFDGDWVETPIYVWEELKAGNLINGPTILESSTTTLVVPKQKYVSVDEYLTVWLK